MKMIFILQNSSIRKPLFNAIAFATNDAIDQRLTFYQNEPKEINNYRRMLKRNMYFPIHIQCSMLLMSSFRSFTGATAWPNLDYIWNLH